MRDGDSLGEQLLAPPLSLVVAAAGVESAMKPSPPLLAWLVA
jgi:hypothetical protein